MTIGQVGGAAPSPNIDTQLHAGAAEGTSGHMVAPEHLSERDRALFNAASQWSKPGGTPTALEDMKQVKIAESRHIEDWDEAIDSNPGEVRLQTLTGILRNLFDGAFRNKCKKLLLVSNRGQILMTRRGLGADMCAHIEGEGNYKKEKHLSIDDKLTLSVLRALYSDNIVQKFLPLNGSVGRGPAAADMPDDTDASDNTGSRPGYRRRPGPGFVPGNESESEFGSEFESESESDHGAINSGVYGVRFGGSNVDTLCIRMSDKPGVDVTADHIQSDASDFDIETFNRDAGLTEERNVLHSNFGSAEEIIPKQIVSPAASELRVDSASSVEPINDADPAIDNLIYVEVKITPENVVTTMSTIDGGVASKTTALASPPSSPAPAVTPLNNGVDDERYQKNLADFDARPKSEIDYRSGLPMPNLETEVTRL